MHQKNMLTQHDLNLIGELIDKKFDQRFEENAQLIIREVYKIIDPMAKDIAILKKDMSIVKDQITILNDSNALTQKRLHLLETRNTS